MPAQYIYQHSAGSNVDLSARVRAYRTEATTNAEEGSVAISTFLVDDEDAGLDIKGHRTWVWRESSESSNSRVIYLGYTADRDITRGPFRVTHARQWAVNTSDINTIMGRRIMRGADAKRPAETDVARVQWLMTTSEFGNGVTDSTYISTSSPVAMDAVDYRNQKCLDILDDCAQASGKNYFLLLNEIPSPATWALFYDFAHSTAYSSSVRLTNVLADADSSTTYLVYTDDLKLNRDPSRVYSGVIVIYEGGDQYIEDAAVAAEFARRDVISPSWNVKTAAKARARGLRYLADIATEEDRLTMSYLVPLARVNRLKEGHLFQVKFSHLPGYENWTSVRALKRTVKAESEEFYRVTIEATPGLTSGTSCATALSGLSLYDSGIIGGGPPCAVSPTSPSSYPAVVLTFMTMMNDGTCIGPPIVGPNLTISGFTELDKYQGPPAACEHTLLGLGYKALTSGSPGSMSYTFTGNGAQAYRAIGINIPTSATSAVQHATSTGSQVTLSSAPTAGNLLVMFRAIETGGWTSTPGAGWTRIGDEVMVNPGGISEHRMDVYCRCVQTGDTASWGTGSGSFSHWAFLSEWAIT